MSNTKKATGVVTKKGRWAQLQEQAAQRAAARGARPKIEPYVFDDVEPPIVISAPDDKRLLIISEALGPDLTFHPGRVMPLLRALCGNEFQRVWMSIPDDDDSSSDMLMLITQALIDHFGHALHNASAAAELPGGTEASSS